MIPDIRLGLQRLLWKGCIAIAGLVRRSVSDSAVLITAVSRERSRLREKMQLDRSLEGSVPAIDGYLLGGDKKVPSVACLYPKS